MSTRSSVGLGQEAGFASRRFRTFQLERLDALADESRTIVIFSAPSRVAGDLADLARVLGAHRAVAVTRELTKLHEEVFHGALEDAARRWPVDGTALGEFTLVVAGAEPAAMDPGLLLEEVAAEQARGASRSDAVRAVAARHGVSRRRLYDAAIRGRGGA